MTFLDYDKKTSILCVEILIIYKSNIDERENKETEKSKENFHEKSIKKKKIT